LKLVDAINKLNLDQIIAEPTHYLENSASMLDLILTDSHGSLSNVTVSLPILTLGYCVTSCSVAFSHSTDRVYIRKIRDYKRGKYEGLNATVYNQFNRWDYIHNSVETNANKFNCVLIHCALSNIEFDMTFECKQNLGCNKLEFKMLLHTVRK